ILFREYLSMLTPNWLLYFGLLFIVFILASPEGLAGIGKRLYRIIVPEQKGTAAMSQRVTATDPDFVPAFLEAVHRDDLHCREISKQFGGIKAVDNVDLSVRGQGVHALIGPNGAGKT